MCRRTTQSGVFTRCRCTPDSHPNRGAPNRVLSVPPQQVEVTFQASTRSAYACPGITSNADHRAIAWLQPRTLTPARLLFLSREDVIGFSRKAAKAQRDTCRRMQDRRGLSSPDSPPWESAQESSFSFCLCGLASWRELYTESFRLSVDPLKRGVGTGHRETGTDTESRGPPVRTVNPAGMLLTIALEGRPESRSSRPGQSRWRACHSAEPFGLMV